MHLRTHIHTYRSYPVGNSDVESTLKFQQYLLDVEKKVLKKKCLKLILKNRVDVISDTFESYVDIVMDHTDVKAFIESFYQ